jgi:hypothetical protein
MNAAPNAGGSAPGIPGAAPSAPSGLVMLALAILNLGAQLIITMARLVPGLAIAAAFVALVLLGHEGWAVGPFVLLVASILVAPWAWGRP